MTAPLETPAYEWGFSTIGCPERTWDDVASLAGRFGVRCVELRSLAGNLDLVSVLRSFDDGPEGFAIGLKNDGLRIPVLASGFLLSSNDEQSRAHLVELAECADVIGCPWIRVFGGRSGNEEPDRSAWAAIGQTLDWWRNIRSASNLSAQILVETHDIFSSSAACLELERISGGDIPVLWDLQHTCGTRGEEPAGTWDRIGALVQHVHVSDRPERGRVSEPVLPGRGNLPVREALTILTRSGFAGTVCLEWERLWHPALPPLEAALQAARDAWSLGSPRQPDRHADIQGSSE